MIKIKIYIFILIICLSMMVYWPIAVLGGIFLPEKPAFYVASAWGRFMLIIIKYVLGISYKVTGSENITKTPTVVLSKHQSALDIFVLLTIFSPQAWVFKKEILNIPCFGWALWATKPIAIDRKAGRRALSLVIEKGIEKIQKGYWVIMYPEGTRILPGEKGNYKSGGVILAQKAEVPITPVALNTGLFWVKGKGLQNSGVVDIVVGESIQTEGRETKEILNDVESWIETNSLKIINNHPYYIANKSKEKILN